MEEQLKERIVRFLKHSPDYAIKKRLIHCTDVQRLLEVAFFAHENNLSISKDLFMEACSQLQDLELSEAQIATLADQAAEMLDYMNQMSKIGLIITKQ